MNDEKDQKQKQKKNKNHNIRCEVCHLSGSLMCNDYYGRKYISKIANLCTFKHNTTTISAELNNLHTIEMNL